MHCFKLSFQTYRTIYSCRSFHHSPSKLLSHQHTHLDDVSPMASLLKSRSVIRFRGPNTNKFLQGLLTNDVRRFTEPFGEKTSTLVTPNLSIVSVSPLYAALLTPQGRFLYDLFLYQPSWPNNKLDGTTFRPGSDLDEEFDLFAGVDATVLDELLECFKKYRLRSKVEIENVAEEFSCWQRFGRNLSDKSSSAEESEVAAIDWGGGVDHVGMSASKGNNCEWQWFRDPRLECFRGIFPSSSTTPPLVESDKETNEQNYLLWRLDKGVAEGSTEIPKGEAIPLEYNLVGLNAISFNKGCYVGQELIARTHHCGVIRKHLLPLKFVDDNRGVEQKVAPGSDVVDTASNKKVGTVRTALGCCGLGLMKLDEAFKGTGMLSIKGQDDVKVEAIQPEWWPPEWIQENQQHNALA